METDAACTAANCPTVGVDAVALDRHRTITTDDGDLIIYDDTQEEAWLQSDVYLILESRN